MTKNSIISLCLAVIVFGASFNFVSATTTEDLSSDISNKESAITNIKQKIDQYKERIESYENSQVSLANEVAILENRVKKTQLDITHAELEIDKVELELRETSYEIELAKAQIIETKKMIENVLREMNTYDNKSTLEIIFGNDVFSEFFDQIQYLETLQVDVSSQVETVERLQVALVEKQKQQTDKHDRLVELRVNLNTTKLQLEEEQGAKELLLEQAQNSEIKFKQFTRELKEEQQYIQSQIFRLQERLQKQIDEGGEEAEVFLGPTVLSWPVSDPVITATFHDPTYPFRHLFEHSGLDMAVPQGSTVRAAAPGYVAWARTGRSYGNYIMIIHANGMASLYAHLSAMDVVADQFVERGQKIGKSGGMPGTQGAGLSTGPHLHFEARKDGIPRDPYKYLVD